MEVIPVNMMNFSYAVIKVRSFSKHCINKNSIIMVPNIFHLFRFFTYWSKWSFPWRKPWMWFTVVCLALMITLVHWWAQQWFSCRQRINLSGFQWEGHQPFLSMMARGVMQIQGNRLKTYSVWERHIFLEALFLTL